MKISLNPIVEITNEEKDTLRAFVANLTEACDKVDNCDICPLNRFREDCGLNDGCPPFIYDLLQALGIN